MSKADANRQGPAPCPTCGVRSACIMTFSKAGVPPRPDDFAICLNCGAVLMFGADRVIHRPAWPAARRVLGQPGVREILAQARAARLAAPRAVPR